MPYEDKSKRQKCYVQLDCIIYLYINDLSLCLPRASSFDFHVDCPAVTCCPRRCSAYRSCIMMVLHYTRVRTVQAKIILYNCSVILVVILCTTPVIYLTINRCNTTSFLQLMSTVKQPQRFTMTYTFIINSIPGSK